MDAHFFRAQSKTQAESGGNLGGVALKVFVIMPLTKVRGQVVGQLPERGSVTRSGFDAIAAFELNGNFRQCLGAAAPRAALRFRQRHKSQKLKCLCIACSKHRVQLHCRRARADQTGNSGSDRHCRVIADRFARESLPRHAAAGGGGGGGEKLKNERN